MPTRRTTVDHTTDLDWWRDTVADLTASDTYPTITVVESADVDHTTIATRFNPATGQRVPRLVVATTDITLAHTKAGRWVIVHALESDQRTPPRQMMRRLALITCTLTTIACGYTLLSTAAASAQLLASAAGIAIAAAAAWLGWYEWTLVRDRVICADVAATRRYGLPAACTVLATAGHDALYRTGFHTFVAARNPITVPNRIERLSTQFSSRPR